MPSTFGEKEYVIRLTDSFTAYLQSIVDGSVNELFPALTMKYINGNGDTIISTGMIEMGETDLVVNGLVVGGIAEVVSAYFIVEVHPETNITTVVNELRVLVSYNAPIPEEQYVEIIAVRNEDFTLEDGGSR